MCVDRDCGHCRVNPNSIHNAAKGFALFWVAVFVIAGWAAIAHFLELALVAVGALAVGSVIGYGCFLRVRYLRRQAMPAGAQQQAFGGARQREPVAAPSQQALPAPEVHQHVHLHGADAVQAWGDR